MERNEQHAKDTVRTKLDYVARTYYDMDIDKAARAIDLFIGRYDDSITEYALDDNDIELHCKFVEFCDFYGEELFIL